MSEWKKIPLPDVLDFQEGPGILAKDFRVEGIPLLRIAGLKRGAPLLAGCNFLDPEMVESRWGHFRLRVGDVLLSTSASLGEVAVVDSSGHGAIPYTGIIRFRPKGEFVDPSFIQFMLSAPSFKQQIEAMGVGSVMKHFGPSHLRQMTVNLPPLEHQCRISSMLGALDDKIAVNERIADVTRRLGFALFARALLSGNVVEFDVESLSSFITRGVAPKYSESPNDLVVLNQKCVRGGRVNLAPARLALSEKVGASKILQPNDVLVNSTGVGTLGRVALWASGQAATVDSHITIVRFDRELVDPVCAGFAMLRAQPEIEALGEGSTGQTELRRNQLGSLVIRLPGVPQQRELRPQLDVLEARADQALSESRTLAALRDTLLPQLMSGRLRVKDAEKIVEEHT